MINILIVDDDSSKIKDIYAIINEFPEISRENVDHALEVKKALQKLHSTQYDLVFLDIKLPSEIGCGTDDNGGIHLLNCINSEERIKKPSHIIGFTSHDDSLGNYEKEFRENIWALLKYCKQTNDWKEQIRKKLRYLINWKPQITSDLKYNQLYNFDFAIITAVEREYKSVLDLDIEWKDISIQNDGTQYKEGIIAGKTRNYSVIVARQHQMGMTAASTLSMKLINNFKPRYICMLGIAAGKRERVALGDILIAAESWDYGSGKIRENKEDISNYLFEPEPHQINIDSGLKEILSCDYTDELLDIRRKWNKGTATEIRHDLKIHVGPLASGASVIQDESAVKKYIDTQNRKLLGLDMETYAVYYAAENCHTPRPKFFAMKAVCDYADTEKNDDYQAYAAYVSSQFFYKLVSNSILEL